MELIKTAIFTIIMPGSVTVLFPYLILWPQRSQLHLLLSLQQYVGAIFMLTGISIYVWCALDFALKGKGTPAPIDPPKKLVVSGAYRYVRNPMYVAVMCVLIGESLLFASLALLLYAATVFLCFNLFVMLYEEPVLTSKFGESYKDYCRRVSRWLPRVQSYS
ncbi:MAG TPA: isoprenylcysteine carboxylmethyltransferase family protein [Blastocatellia bacterium]|nr:isoprenylcysteine carboxylmethyltransferase family protein [Blastocatellia bacterium]